MTNCNLIQTILGTKLNFYYKAVNTNFLFFFEKIYLQLTKFILYVSSFRHLRNLEYLTFQDEYTHIQSHRIP